MAWTRPTDGKSREDSIAEKIPPPRTSSAPVAAANTARGRRSASQASACSGVCGCCATRASVRPAPRPPGGERAHVGGETDGGGGLVVGAVDRARKPVPGEEDQVEAGLREPDERLDPGAPAQLGGRGRSHVPAQYGDRATPFAVRARAWTLAPWTTFGSCCRRRAPPAAGRSRRGAAPPPPSRRTPRSRSGAAARAAARSRGP